MKKILVFLYQFYKWLFVYPFFIINSIFLGIIAVILSLLWNEKISSYIAGVMWANINCFITPVIVKLRGRDNIMKNQSYIVVVNHQSAFDILVLYAKLGIDFKWIMKKEVRKIPGVGFGSKALGHILIDRSSIKAVINTMNEAKTKIKDGTSVVFFPEGTRSMTSEMLPFKKGAFWFAIDLNLPILPVTIKGTREILPSGTLNLLPGKAEIIVHPQIDIHKYSKENISELIAETRTVIEHGM
jgi:1-acyl-sn-glycerol-3-phosphate acyltransferase